LWEEATQTGSERRGGWRRTDDPVSPLMLFGATGRGTISPKEVTMTVRSNEEPPQNFEAVEGLTSSEIGRLIDETMREYDEGDPLLESYQKSWPPAGPSERPG
jgi:hypothetical protein